MELKSEKKKIPKLIATGTLLVITLHLSGCAVA